MNAFKNTKYIRLKFHALFDVISKCKFITFHRTKKTVIFSYSISKIKLSVVSNIKDLCITFGSNLTFNTHNLNLCS